MQIAPEVGNGRRIAVRIQHVMIEPIQQKLKGWDFERRYEKTMSITRAPFQDGLGFGSRKRSRRPGGLCVAASELGEADEQGRTSDERKSWVACHPDGGSNVRATLARSKAVLMRRDSGHAVRHLHTPVKNLQGQTR